MQSVSVFIYSDVSRTQWVCRVIHIFFGSPLDNCAKFHHCRICATDFREGDLYAPPHP